MKSYSFSFFRLQILISLSIKFHTQRDRLYSLRKFYFLYKYRFPHCGNYINIDDFYEYNFN